MSPWTEKWEAAFNALGFPARLWTVSVGREICGDSASPCLTLFSFRVVVWFPLTFEREVTWFAVLRYVRIDHICSKIVKHFKCKAPSVPQLFVQISDSSRLRSKQLHLSLRTLSVCSREQNRCVPHFRNYDREPLEIRFSFMKTWNSEGERKRTKIRRTFLAPEEWEHRSRSLTQSGHHIATLTTWYFSIREEQRLLCTAFWLRCKVSYLVKFVSRATWRGHACIHVWFNVVSCNTIATQADGILSLRARMLSVKSAVRMWKTFLRAYSKYPFTRLSVSSDRRAY